MMYMCMVFTLGIIFIMVRNSKKMQWLPFLCSCVLSCFKSPHKCTLCLQLQKNSLLTLCSDRILQAVEFDKYRCARLVMNCLCTFDDPSMNRMSVAICSILGKLAAQIPDRRWYQVILRTVYINTTWEIKIYIPVIDCYIKEILILCILYIHIF